MSNFTVQPAPVSEKPSTMSSTACRRSCSARRISVSGNALERMSHCLQSSLTQCSYSHTSSSISITADSDYRKKRCHSTIRNSQSTPWASMKHSGNFGRKMNAGRDIKSESFLLRKARSLKGHLLWMSRHFTLSPKNTLRALCGTIVTGVAAAVKGQ